MVNWACTGYAWIWIGGFLVSIPEIVFWVLAATLDDFKVEYYWLTWAWGIAGGVMLFLPMLFWLIAIINGEIAILFDGVTEW